MGQSIQRMDQVKFAEDSLKKFEGIWSASTDFFNGCLPQILLGSFFNTLSHIIIT